MVKPCYSLPTETELSSIMKTVSSPAKPASKGPMVTKNPVFMSRELNMDLPLISGKQDIGNAIAKVQEKINNKLQIIVITKCRWLASEGIDLNQLWETITG